MQNWRETQKQNNLSTQTKREREATNIKPLKLNRINRVGKIAVTPLCFDVEEFHLYSPSPPPGALSIWMILCMLHCPIARALAYQISAQEGQETDYGISQPVSGRTMSQSKLYFCQTSIRLPFFSYEQKLIAISNRLFYTYIHSHTILSFTHSYMLLFPPKTTNTIHYVNTATGTKQSTLLQPSFKLFSTATELFNPQYK